MKIELEEPYKSKYRLGYLRTSKDGRRRVELINSSKDRTTTAYARYLKSVEVGYILSDETEVDHIDGNCSNDEISNLQILTIKEHMEKSSKEMSTGRSITECTCSFCGKIFTRFTNRINENNAEIFCSHSCNGKFYAKYFKKTKSDEIISEIRRLNKEGWSGYKIAKHMNISRNTISKYIKE